jgi:hypothetical protein
VTPYWFACAGRSIRGFKMHAFALARRACGNASRRHAPSARTRRSLQPKAD